jgi:hypothetical protein
MTFINYISLNTWSGQFKINFIEAAAYIACRSVLPDKSKDQYVRSVDKKNGTKMITVQVQI